jgi:hypothetical protein
MRSFNEASKEGIDTRSVTIVGPSERQAELLPRTHALHSATPRAAPWQPELESHRQPPGANPEGLGLVPHLGQAQAAPLPTKPCAATSRRRRCRRHQLQGQSTVWIWVAGGSLRRWACGSGGRVAPESLWTTRGRGLLRFKSV